MRRGQVCPSSNKGVCLLTHPLFAIYIPDTFDRTAHLSPPPSRRFSTSIFVHLSPSKDRMRVMAPAHPLVAKIGCVQFGRLLLNLQSTFESDQLTASTRCYSCEKDQVCISQKEDV